MFLGGGIGITPFRSIVFRAAKEKLPHRIFPFYSNRRPEDAPFLDELQALERENPNYKLIASMTDMSKSQRPWQGEAGLIDKEMLARHLKDAASSVYYVAGPPEMVKGLKTMISGRESTMMTFARKSLPATSRALRGTKPVAQSLQGQGVSLLRDR